MAQVKTLASLLLLILSSSASAGTVVFRIHGTDVQFYDDPKQGLTLSLSCAKGTGQFDCDAHRALSQASIKALPADALEGGANPGAAVCHALQGKIAFGQIKGGGQNSFCQFADGSLIDNGSLSSRARENDELSASARR